MSPTLSLYTRWLASASEADIQRVDNIYRWAEDNYGDGADVIVECMSPEDILEECPTITDARRLASLRMEQEANTKYE